MAKIISSYREEFTEEILECEKHKLLDNDEIKILLEKREVFYQNINAKNPKIIDFLTFVDFEKKFLQLLRLRKHQLGYIFFDYLYFFKV
jgi:hypothetical protein